MDPYSHTPGHAGAQQPGMTGQVKEEILTRLAELGVRVSEGAVHFDPGLLRSCEFVTMPGSFRYLDVDGEWQQIKVPKNGLAFTWCQVPVVYRLDAGERPVLTLDMDDGTQMTLAEPLLSAGLSTELFVRSGRIRRIELALESRQLFDGQTDTPATGARHGRQ
jgi:hypothetical protein